MRAAVKEMHSYTTPAILVLPIEGGEPGYLDWLMPETESSAREPRGRRSRWPRTPLRVDFVARSGREAQYVTVPSMPPLRS